MKSLTKSRLRELLEYSSSTGKFVWKVQRGIAKVGSIAGKVNITGYRYISVDGKLYKAHRLAWLYVYGEFPPEDIDHINRVRDDNRIINLRKSSRGENLKNTSLSKNNSSGITGVSIDSRTRKWRPTIWDNYKQIELGLTSDFFEACCRRKSAEIGYGYTCG